MKNYELLDLIGGVDEDHVLAADVDVTRPRFGWKTLAACAACAALVLCAYPVWRAAQPHDTPLPGTAPLHAYTVVEGQQTTIMTTQGEIKAPAGGTNGSAPIMPGGALIGSEDAGQEDIDGSYYHVPGGDVSVAEDPYRQYNALFENARLDQYPEWYGGAYIGHDSSGEPSRLVVCVVEGFHTVALEQQIAEWCGEGVWACRDVKYPRGYLQELMERLNDSWSSGSVEADEAISGWGVYEQDNCIQMDCHDVPNTGTLAMLAELDPDGDAIRVRVFTDRHIAFTDAAKAPAPVGPIVPPVPNERTQPAAVTEPSPPIAAEPGTAPSCPAGALPPHTEDARDVPGAVGDLPQARSDVIHGADG